MAKQLVVNTDDLRNGADRFQHVLDELNTAMDNLDRSIDTLKSSGWRSSASSAYFNNYDGKWKENLKRCITMISMMESALRYAEQQYDQLSDDFRSYVLNRMNW